MPAKTSKKQKKKQQSKKKLASTKASGKKQVRKRSTGEKRAGKKPTRKKQAGKKQVGKKPTRKKQVGKKQAGKKQVGKKRVGKKRVGKKQVGKKRVGKKRVGKKRAQKRGRSQKERSAQQVYRLYEEALVFLHRKKYKKARERLTKVVEKFSHEIEVVARATSFLRLCDRNLQPKEKPPRTAEEIFDEGVLYHNAGQYEEALHCYSRALKLSKKKNDHIYYALAATELSTGNIDNALKYLKKAIEIKEENRFFAYNDPDFERLATNQKFRELIHPE